jgi:hypothetical protein
MLILNLPTNVNFNIKDKKLLKKFSKQTKLQQPRKMLQKKPPQKLKKNSNAKLKNYKHQHYPKKIRKYKNPHKKEPKKKHK